MTGAGARFSGNVDPDRLRSGLSFLPLDFIPGMDLAAHREEVLAECLRPLPESDDLRFVSRAHSGEELFVAAERLPWDSDFFGYGVARLRGIFPLAPSSGPIDVAPALAELGARAERLGIRYLFAPVDPRDLDLLRGLGMSRFCLIETRAYYHLDLTSFAPIERHSVRLATPGDCAPLARAARLMVNPYDRFHADPFLDRATVDRLMERWVEASLCHGFADGVVVPAVETPSAFVSYKLHREHWAKWGVNLAQPILSAVMPEFKGWNQKLYSELALHLRASGATHAYVATQLTNKAVVKGWERIGYRYGRGEHIFRIVIGGRPSTDAPSFEM